MLGYIMRKTEFPMVSLLIGLLLARMFEMPLRQSILMHGSDFAIFLTGPVALVFLILVGISVWRVGKSRRRSTP